MFKKRFNEKYHDNCHDYLQSTYIEKYAYPKYKKFLYNLRDTIPKIPICDDTDPDDYIKTIVCDQHALIVTHQHDKYPIVATYALNACIGLVMYVKEYKIASISHLDGLPGYSKKSANAEGVKIKFSPVYENIKSILKYIHLIANKISHRRTNYIEIDYYLIGGIFDLSEIMIHDIIECINKINSTNDLTIVPDCIFYLKLKGRNLLGPENQARNICLNSCTGAITYFNYVTNTEQFDKNRGPTGLPINILKAPVKSEAYLDVTYVSKV